MRESKHKSQNLMDSQFHYHFQDNSSSFHQNNEPINYEKMLEAMTQAQNTRNRDIDMMVESLRSHRPDVTNYSVRAEESCSFGNQDSISEQPLELAQTPNFEKDIDSLASFPFPEIELENEYDLEP